jgi:hypothetical protein
LKFAITPLVFFAGIKKTEQENKTDTKKIVFGCGKSALLILLQDTHLMVDPMMMQMQPSSSPSKKQQNRDFKQQKRVFNRQNRVFK